MEIQNETDFRAFVAHKKWTFAKSMAHIPHEYVVRQGPGDAAFVNAVLFIRAHGRAEKFFKKSYTYFYCDGWKYWTMGNPIDETTIINRAKA